MHSITYVMHSVGTINGCKAETTDAPWGNIDDPLLLFGGNLAIADVSNCAKVVRVDGQNASPWTMLDLCVTLRRSAKYPSNKSAGRENPILEKLMKSYA